jgi:DNA polymerase-3 subunit gamma/tau
MSLALYRKYRPASFAEVVGQEHVTEPICQALDTGRIHHAYLFSGPRGCGKTSSARILARSLNCEKGPTSTPCGECDSCVALAPMGPGSLDVIEIDAASHGLVDDARDLRDRAFFAPVSSRFKIYVIDEAHMISSAAFNALLKVVEEPPPHVKFIFATTEPEKVLTTIKSRTFHYRFRLIPPGVMRDHLALLAEREGIDIDPLCLPLVVRAGAGSARDAQSILDQLASGSGGERITYERALSLLGYTDATLLDEVVDAFAAADGASVFAAVDRVIEAGLDPRRFAQDLLERFRDLVVLDAVPEAADKGLIDAPLDALDRMSAQVSRFGTASLSRAGDVMATALVDMRGTTSPRLVLELACSRILLPGAADDVSALLARLDRLEKRIAVTGVAPAPVAAPVAEAPAAAPVAQPVAAAAPVTEPEATHDDVVEPPAAPATPVAQDTAPASVDEPVDELVDAGMSAPPAEPAPVAAAEPVPAAPPAPVEPAPATPVGALDLTALRRLWDDVLEAVKSHSRTAHALMFSSQLETLEGTVLTLSFPTAALATRFANDVADPVIKAIKDVAGVDVRIKTTTGSSTAAAPSAPASEPAAPAAAEPPAERRPVPTINVDEVVEDDPDDSVDITGDTVQGDPDEVALALVKGQLGGTVIGELDQH